MENAGGRGAEGGATEESIGADGAGDDGQTGDGGRPTDDDPAGGGPVDDSQADRRDGTADATTEDTDGSAGDGAHVVIVGAYGSAGVATAQRLAAAVGDDGPIDRLTLVDDGEPGGGLCILRGCMPSKEVLSAAAHRYHARHDDRLVGDAPTLDLERVVERKDEHTSTFAAHRRAAVHDLAVGPGVEFVHGTARFRDADTVVVTPTTDRDPELAGGDGDADDRPADHDGDLRPGSTDSDGDGATTNGGTTGSATDGGRAGTATSAAGAAEESGDAGSEAGTESVDASTESVDAGTESADGPTSVAASAADLVYEPDYTVVATGSRVNLPDLPGLSAVDYQTSADVLDATDLPDSAVVMGFGYVGVELSVYLAEAGVDVTAIEHDERPLDEADPAFGDELLAVSREEFGIDVRTEVREERVEPIGSGDGDERDGVRLHLDDGTAVEAEALFVFTGRRPNVERLDLDAAGLSPESGWVDDTMRAAERDDVFVVGDANGKEPILHVAKEQGFLAGDNVLAALRDEPLAEYRPLHHHVIFSGAGVYPYVRVGHSAASAAEAGLDVHVVTRRAAEDGVFKTKAASRGLARLVVGTDGSVLGYQGLHYHADVMAKTMQVVIESRMDVRDVPNRSYHPTTPEILDGLFRAAAAEIDGE